MDELTKTELGIEQRVVAAEHIKLQRSTVLGLCEAIVQAYQGQNKPVRLFYAKGEDLLIERLVPESQVQGDGQFVTAYQMVRQHAEVQILENESSPVEQLCKAAMSLAERDYEATMFVAASRAAMDKWFSIGRADLIFRIPLVEDPDCPPNFLILCGSQSGRMMSQIEYAVFCRMEK